MMSWLMFYDIVESQVFRYLKMDDKKWFLYWYCKIILWEWKIADSSERGFEKEVPRCETSFKKADFKVLLLNLSSTGLSVTEEKIRL